MFSVFLYYISGLPLLSSYIIPPDRPFASPQDWSLRRSVKPYDVFFVDQLSACVPALRWGSRTRVVFYCHFPDLLLSKTRGEHDEGEKESTLKQLYRMPLDWVEETTTGESVSLHRAMQLFDRAPMQAKPTRSLSTRNTPRASSKRHFPDCIAYRVACIRESMSRSTSRLVFLALFRASPRTSCLS